MKGILLLIFVAILLGLSSFQSQSAQLTEQNEREQFLFDLADSILSPDHEIGRYLQEEVEDYFNDLSVNADISIYSLSSRYKIIIDRHCFKKPHDSKIIIFYKSLEKQIIELANYVQLIHKLSLGKDLKILAPTRFKICSSQYPESAATYDSTNTLHINTSYIIGSKKYKKEKLYYLNSNEIQSIWNSGIVIPEIAQKNKDHSLLDLLSPSKMDIGWMLLNPYGLVQSSLRKLIHQYHDDIDKLLNRFSSSNEEAINQLTNSADINSLPEDLRISYSSISQDATKLPQLVKIVHSLMQDENFFNEVISAKTAALLNSINGSQKESSHNKNILIYEQTGYINIGNHHVIDVSTKLYKNFRNVLEIPSENITIRKIKQTGIINVFTIDDISVNAVLSLMDLSELKTLILGKALTIYNNKNYKSSI